MPLYFANLDIPKRQAHERMRAGEIQRIVRGVYCDADEDPADVVRVHAGRIAAHLYRDAYLSRESAWLRGVAPDGRVHLNGASRYSATVAGIDFVVSKGPPARDIRTVAWRDPTGEITLRASGTLQAALETLNAGHGSAPIILDAMIEALVREYGDLEAVLGAGRSLGGRMRMDEGLKRFEELIEAKIQEDKIMNSRVLFRKHIAWHCDPIGELSYDGEQYTFNARDGWIMPLSSTGADLPPIIENLLAEGQVGSLTRRTEADALASRRYLGNVAVVDHIDDLDEMPEDYLMASLGDHRDGPWFSGKVSEQITHMTQALQQGQTGAGLIADLIQGAGVPTVSGAQVKMPVAVHPDGYLTPATADRPWTHILKIPPIVEARLGIYEWTGGQLAAASGIETSTSALLRLDDRFVGLLVERFDIRHDPVEDQRRLFVNDVCAGLGLPAASKGTGTWEQIARHIADVSADADADRETLFRRAILTWLYGDNDMHLKNVAMLHEYTESSEGLRRQARLAPAYDVTTAAFMGTGMCVMALPLNSKRNALSAEDFLAFGKTCGLTKGRARDILSEVSHAVVDRLAEIAVDPAVVGDAPDCASVLRTVAGMAASRAADLGVRIEPPAFEAAPAPDDALLAPA